MNARVWFLTFLVGCLGGTACAQGPAMPGRPSPPDALLRVIDLTVTDADLPKAIQALDEATGLRPTLEVEVPDTRLTLSAKGLPVRDILDALAALHGIRWERRLTAIVFTAARPAAAAPRVDPRPGGGGFTQVERAVQMIRALGLTGTEAPRFSARLDPLSGVPQELADLFTPQQVEQMRQAGRTGAIEFGTRVADLPADAQQRLLDWKRAQHQQRMAMSLWRAAQPFDANKYLGAVVYIKAMEIPGKGRVPALAIGDDRWSESTALGGTSR